MRNDELEMEAISGGNAELAAALQRNGLPTDDLEESGRRFFGFRDAEGRRVGFIGVEWAGGDALLRSLVVEEDRRRQGFDCAYGASACMTGFGPGTPPEGGII